MVLYDLLLAHCLYHWYSTTFYWLPAYPYGTLLHSAGPLPISLVLYYLLLGPCLSRWYSITFYLIPANIYGILLPSTDPPLIPLVLCYLSLAHCLSLWYSTTLYWALPVPMILYFLQLAPCLFLWYSTIFYWLTSNTFGTLLSSIYQLYLTTFIWPFLCTAYTYGTRLPSTGSLPIPMVLYYLLEAERL